MRLLQNFYYSYGHADDTGTFFVYSGRGWGYTASMLYPKFRKEMILTGILCGK